MSEYKYLWGYRFRRPRELSYTCGSFLPEETEKVNALMAIAATARDPADDLLVGFLLPPAIAAALIAACESGDIVQFAHEFRAMQVRSPAVSGDSDIDLPPLRYD